MPLVFVLALKILFVFDSSVIKGTGFSVCDVFTGHGIGKEFHSLPQIIHTGLTLFFNLSVFIVLISNGSNCSLVFQVYDPCMCSFSVCFT